MNKRCLFFYILFLVFTVFSSELNPKLLTNILEKVNSTKTEDPIASVLKEIIKLDPSYKRHWASLIDSNSSQAASIDSPRVILYGNNASPIFAFTGKDKKGGNKIEMTQFNSKTQSWEFQEIILSSNNILSINKNPKNCTSCHGNPPEPLWEEYPFWPGALGFKDDMLAYKTDVDHLNTLKKLQKTNTRYQFLELPSLKKEKNHHRFTKKVQEISPSSNFLLSTLLNKKNMPREIKKIKENKNFDSFKYFLMAEALGCSISKGFLPTSISHSVEKETLIRTKKLRTLSLKNQREIRLRSLSLAKKLNDKELENEMHKKIDSLNKELLKVPNINSKDLHYQYSENSIFKQLFLENLGIHIHLDLSENKNSFHYNDGLHNFSVEFLGALRKEKLFLDSTIQKKWNNEILQAHFLSETYPEEAVYENIEIAYLTLQPSVNREFWCQKLSKLSLEASKSLTFLNSEITDKKNHQ